MHLPGCLSSRRKAHFSFLHSLFAQQILSETPIGGLLTVTVGGCYAAGGSKVQHTTTYCGQRLRFSNVNAPTKIAFPHSQGMPRGVEVPGRLADLKSGGWSHLRNLLPPGLALRHGSADVMKLSDLRDRCRPITVGNTTERCHTWSVSYKTDQKQHIYLRVISYRGVVKKTVFLRPG